MDDKQDNQQLVDLIASSLGSKLGGSYIVERTRYHTPWAWIGVNTVAAVLGGQDNNKVEFCVYFHEVEYYVMFEGIVATYPTAHPELLDWMAKIVTNALTTKQ